MKFFLVGFMGAGKSYWAQQLSAYTGISTIDTDSFIEQKEGKTIAQIFRDSSEEYFRSAENDCLSIILDRPDSYIIACGGGLPCHSQNMKRICAAGIVIYLNIPTHILCKRLASEQHKRPLLCELSTQKMQQFVMDTLHLRYPIYSRAHFSLPVYAINLPTFVSILHRHQSYDMRYE